MARLVLGIGTSHTPMLTLPSAQWIHRAQHDYDSDALSTSDGRVMDYATLLAEVGPRFADRIGAEELEEKAGICQRALDRIAADIKRHDPDLVIIVGDDQSELFTANNQPAFAIYHGEDVVTYHGKYADANAPDWMRTVGTGYLLDRSHSLQGSGEIALRLIEALIDRDVDVASVAGVDDPSRGGIGHAYGFVIKRLFHRPIPVVPVMLNTYYPPNVPSAARCYNIGVKLREVLDALPEDHKVAIVASGGLSHFIVDEELDRGVMRAIETSDAAALRAIPRQALKSGSSEILNWVMVAGAVSDMRLSWSEYQSIYRTPAGTGVGAAFCVWEHS